MKLSISVGASTDASWNAVFRNVADAAARAQKKMSSDEQSAMRMHEMLLKEKLAKDKMNLASQIAAEKSVHDHLNALEMTRLRQSVQRTKKAAQDKASSEISEADRVAREVKRIQANVEKSRIHGAALQQLGMPGGGGINWGRRMGYWASRNFSPVTPMLSYAGRMAGGIARGAGINVDIGSMIGNKISNEKSATDISNAGFVRGASGAAGQRQDPADIYKETKAAADATAMSQEDALKGLRQFVDKTGDLKLGRDVLKDMGKYAKATGTSFEDMVSASGEVALALGDTDHKAEKVKGVMLAIAGQGKLGAVAMHDMANNLAKLAARSHEFHGSVTENIATLGALAQSARMGGGAKSASQATTSVGAFLDVFSKNKRVKEYTALTGKTRNTKDSGGKMANPEELILEMLNASKGDEMKIQKVLGSTQATKAMRGFTNIYNEAGGGDKGLKAVADEFDRIKRAAMNEEQIQEDFALAMKTSESKVQLFNNKMQDVADKMADKVLPALESLAPTAITVVDSFASIVSWLASNPFAIIPTALAAAIAKSGAEQVIRAGVESIFKDISGQTGGKSPGALGNASAGLTIASIAVTAFYVGKMFIDETYQKKDKAVSDDIGAENKSLNIEGTLSKEIAAGKVSPEILKRAKEQAEEDRQRYGELQKQPGFIDSINRGMVRTFGGKDIVNKEDKMAAQRAAELASHAQRLLALIQQGLKVEVKNLPPAGVTPPAAAPGSNTAAPVDN